jgi:hypothetical protein
MKCDLPRLVMILLLGAATQSVGQTTYNGPTVETYELRIELRPLGEDQFTIHLTDKMTGLQASHEFVGEGSNDPEPFLLVQSRYCDTPVILLTVKFPWRHAQPQYLRVLETYAFRAFDFKFVDATFGPLTDIALADDTGYAPSELDMLPPNRVHCLLGNDAKLFELFEQETK